MAVEVNYDFGKLRVILTENALATMLSHRQVRFYSREAGGQLFARLSRDLWRIEVATGPRTSDVRGRFRFWPNRAAEQEEINRYYKEGLEFVGDWHTHPQDLPAPSQSDIHSITNIVRQSTHSLPGILMCIVGRRDPPEGLWMSFHGAGPHHAKLGHLEPAEV